MTVSQWANTRLKLSAEDSAEPGQFDTARAPFQAGIMDAVSEPRVHTVVVMSSAQIGKTVILKAIIGFHVDQDPAPILMLQPTEQMAEAFSKDRLAPMIRDTPALRGKIADPRARDSGNSILHKRFTGGHLTLAGSNSPASLASRPIRVVLCDEVDRYPASAGTEGDPVNLAIKRTSTFWNRRVVLTSTPTVKGISRIELAYSNSDQRRYYVPCPHCGDMHTLKWENVKWPEQEPEKAFMVCSECGGMIEERNKAAMLARGEWRAEFPCKGVAGFHINELYSPWRTLVQVVVDFLQAKQSHETLKTWVNTSLGETWEESSEKSDPETLLERRENYTSSTIPDAVRYLTAGVDVQDDRLEVEVVGWNQTARDTPPESWGIEYRVLHGDPAKMDVWLDLDKVLQSTYRSQNQRTLRVQATCIDSGGHHTAAVYAYCSTRQGQHIHPTKGQPGAKPVWSYKAVKSRKYQASVYWPVGSDTGKDAWYSRLRIKEPGPGYCHFPLAYDQNYFNMLTSEQVRTKYSKGRPVREWFLPSGRRNEALDIRVLTLAALLARPINWDAIKSDFAPKNVAAPRAAPRNSFINRPTGTPWIR